MAAAYGRLHRLGWAHSFETWRDDTLVGGLYGVALGRVFFGESMFARVTDASKVALVHGVEFLRAREFALIDCQVASAHTISLGATNIGRAEFLRLVARALRAAGHAAPLVLSLRREPAAHRFAGFAARYATMRPRSGSRAVAECQKKKRYKWKVR